MAVPCYCGHQDSLSHLLECVGMSDRVQGYRDERVADLVELTKRAHNVNPELPIPFLPAEGDEIQLQFFSDSEEDEDLQKLEVEGDLVSPLSPRALLNINTKKDVTALGEEDITEDQRGEAAREEPTEAAT